MRTRELIGFLCLAAAAMPGVATMAAQGNAPLVAKSVALNAPANEGGSDSDGAAAPAGRESAGRESAGHDSEYLVREVVYNELHDHDAHGYWRYWIARRLGAGTQVVEQIETPQGPMQRLELSDGHPLTADMRAEEDRRIAHLLNSPSEQAQHRKDYDEDERRIGRVLGMLPNAFLYDAAQVEGRSERMAECPCQHMRFRPNPAYTTHSIEARVFHAMGGELWVSTQNKRLVRLDAKVQENVDFGYGILGRLYKDGWFQLERTHVSGEAGAGDWKTQRLEVHLIGRALLLKTFAKETSEVRSGFVPVAKGLSLQAAADLVNKPEVVPPSLAALR